MTIMLFFFALSIPSCREEGKITLKYDGADGSIKGSALQEAEFSSPDPADSVSDSTGGSGEGGQEQSSEPASQSPPPTATPEQELREETGALVFLEFPGGDFFPRVGVRFEKPNGSFVCKDYISPDGRGIGREFKKVLPGDYYRFIVAVEEFEKPYFDKILKISREHPPRFVFGSVSFELPKEHRMKVNTGMALRVRKQPLGDLVFDASFGRVRAYSVYGDVFPHMLVLETGEYSYTVYDLNSKDDLIITDENGREATMPEDSCNFGISEDFPKMVVDLVPYIGISKRVSGDETGLDGY